MSFLFFSIALFYFQDNLFLNSSLAFVFFLGVSSYLFSKPIYNHHTPISTLFIDSNGYGEFYLVDPFDSNNRSEIINNAISVQLLASSRISFIGCWLDFQCLGENKQRSLFIYKDSLSKKNYSRLVNIVTQL
jgi:hypothetical protein